LKVRGRIEGEEKEAEADFVWGAVLGMLILLLLLKFGACSDERVLFWEYA